MTALLLVLLRSGTSSRLQSRLYRFHRQQRVVRAKPRRLNPFLLDRWPHLNGYTYAVNAIVNPIGSAGHLNATDYATIAAEVMKQCDTLDGVQDGILTNAQLCHPDLSPLLCSAPNANATSCLSQAKIDTMKNIWGNWTAQTDAGTSESALSPSLLSGDPGSRFIASSAGYPKGTFLFPGFAVGAESNPFFSVTGQAFPPGPGYFQYQVSSRFPIQSASWLRLRLRLSGVRVGEC